MTSIGDTVLSTLSPEAYKVPTPYGWYAQGSWVNGSPLPTTQPDDAESAESNSSAIHIAVYPSVPLGVNAFTEDDDQHQFFGIAVFEHADSSMDDPTSPDTYLMEGMEATIPGLSAVNELDVVVHADKLTEALEYIKTTLGIIDPERLNANSQGLLSFGEVIASFDLFRDLAGRGKCLNIDKFHDDHWHEKPLRLVKVVDEADGYTIHLLATVSVDKMKLHPYFELHKDEVENEREMARLILSRCDFDAHLFLFIDPLDYVQGEGKPENAYWMLVQKALGL